MYIGPNIPRLGLMRNQLFLGNNPPESLRKMIVSERILACLFVNTEQLVKARIALENPLSIESIAFKRLTAKARQQAT
jgi:hypothetical protein